MTILIELLKCPSVADSSVEVVERKGLGHPDTICDLLSEELSRALARYYLDNFGSVLHHNVDKSLLVGGRSLPAFAGGSATDGPLPVRPRDNQRAGQTGSGVGNHASRC